MFARVAFWYGLPGTFLSIFQQQLSLTLFVSVPYAGVLFAEAVPSPSFVCALRSNPVSRILLQVSGSHTGGGDGVRPGPHRREKDLVK